MFLQPSNLQGNGLTWRLACFFKSHLRSNSLLHGAESASPGNSHRSGFTTPEEFDGRRLRLVGLLMDPRPLRSLDEMAGEGGEGSGVRGVEGVCRPGDAGVLLSGSKAC